jgi:adsorption protein B
VLHGCIRTLDTWTASLLAPVSAWILLSGLDDLFLFLCWTSGFFRSRTRLPSDQELAGLPEKRIAVFVPLWQEQHVVRPMIEHNLAAICYRQYDFFVGTYLNDPETSLAVRELEQRHANVHSALLPHGGPTSKADCLNWIYQYMLLDEERRGIRYEIAVTHDAEDLIHPAAFRWLNYYAGRFDMVQIPVLPLPTPLHHLTHGVYCDEFAENQLRDLQVREQWGGFLPSSGVGTGVSRRALEALAVENSNRIFEPACLTEDYELGFRLHQLGLRQTFLPPRFRSSSPIATREYFPRRIAEAIRQRTRWVIGIVFQGWERHGWRGGWRQIYWHWRDRKVLIGSSVSSLAYVVFLYGLFSLAICRALKAPWQLPAAASEGVTTYLLAATSALQVLYLLSKTACSSRYYGVRHALGVPLRMPWSNLINTLACWNAVFRYCRDRILRRRPEWLKTEHCYPSRAALVAHRPRLGEVLVQNHYLTAGELEEALESQPRGTRLGQHLCELGAINEHQLYEALSLQQNLPLLDIEPLEIEACAARSLPGHVVRTWEALPYRIEQGSLFLVTPEPPGESLEPHLARHTRLSLRFRLVTRSDFERLIGNRYTQSREHIQT